MTPDEEASTVGPGVGYHERFEAERAAGRFVVPRCSECGITFWHPRAHCPQCGSSRVDYVEPAWPAHVYTYTVNHRPKKGDQATEASVIGYIELDDGLRLLANLELATIEGVIGTAVRPEARTSDDGTTFVFVPATGV